MLLFSGHRHSYFLEIGILVLLVPSDADDDDGGGGVPTTLPAWQVPRGYHAQGSNIPFGEFLTLIISIEEAVKWTCGPNTKIISTWVIRVYKCKTLHIIYI